MILKLIVAPKWYSNISDLIVCFKLTDFCRQVFPVFVSESSISLTSYVVLLPQFGLNSASTVI
jgi:hypothetical protein